MPPTHPLPPKKEVALALLERSSVHVHLDPRAGGVVVPPWLKKQAQLVLQVGLNMPVPIPDLHLDDDGMSCTLSFNRSPFFCVVPWASVFAMVGDDGRGMVWPEDVPPEVARQTQARAAQQEPAAPRKDASKRPVLEEVKGDGAAKAKRPRKKPAASVPQGRPEIAPPAPRAADRSTPVASDTNARSTNGRKPKRELPPYLRVVK
jgi:stringent starvation protein B